MLNLDNVLGTMKIRLYKFFYAPVIGLLFGFFVAGLSVGSLFVFNSYLGLSEEGPSWLLPLIGSFLILGSLISLSVLTYSAIFYYEFSFKENCLVIQRKPLQERAEDVVVRVVLSGGQVEDFSVRNQKARSSLFNFLKGLKGAS